MLPCIASSIFGTSSHHTGVIWKFDYLEWHWKVNVAILTTDIKLLVFVSLRFQNENAKLTDMK